MAHGNSAGLEGARAGLYGGGRSAAGTQGRARRAASHRKSRAETLTKGGPGSGVPKVEHAIKLHANDPYKQMMCFLDDLELQAYTGRRRTVAEHTKTRFGETLTRLIGELRHLRMPIQRIDQISRRHAVALVAYWVNEERHSASTVMNKVSQIRKFCELIGKVGAIPKREAFYELVEAAGVPRSALLRHQVAPGSKSWSAAGVEPHGIAELLAAKNFPHESLLVELMLHFGLRVSEVLSLNPYKADVQGGLLLTAGTKGGKDRLVPYMADSEMAAQQREVLDRAIIWAHKNNRRGDMGYPGLTMEKARKKYYNTLETVGLTKAKMGVVSHGLRHEFAANLFEQITGHRPPAEGQEPSEWFMKNRELVDHAYIMVSEALGHWRKDISSAYLGSVARMSKTQKVRIEKLIELIQHTPGVAEGLLAVGVDRAWLTGRGAQGIQLAPHERVQLTVSRKVGDNWTALNEVHAVLEKLLPGRVLVVPLMVGVQPDDGVEVFLN